MYVFMREKTDDESEVKRIVKGLRLKVKGLRLKVKGLRLTDQCHFDGVKKSHNCYGKKILRFVQNDAINSTK